jgi:carbonic anhydrase/acetyltransferase-like protein (isoleucine patch superfamily)
VESGILPVSDAERHPRFPVPIYPYREKLPNLGTGVFLAPSAELAGEIEVGSDCSFWFHTAARGDVNWIRIGERTSVQDGTILHVTHERFPLSIGADVVIGHSCMIHGCTLEDACLVGIGARVLDGAVIESGAQVGAGAVVPPGMRVASGQLALGVPAKVVRPLSDGERAAIREIAERYVRVKNDYLATMGRGY